MKILVVEDNPGNIERAKEQLAEGNELTIMTSFTEFFDAFSRLGIRSGDFRKNEEVLSKLAQFDCVLTDLNLPSPHDQKGEVDGVTGFAIILRCIEAQIKYIGALTDASHHLDVHSKAMDMWIHQKSPFLAGKSRIFLDSYNYVTGGRKKWGNFLKYGLLKEG